jgi:hypothetical protein
MTWEDTDGFDGPFEFEGFGEDFVWYGSPKGLWTDRNGKNHALSEMSLDYLENVKRFLTVHVGTVKAQKKLDEIEQEISRRNKKMTQTHTNTLYVAVIITKGATLSQRQQGDWACFVDSDKETAISRAMEAKAMWNKPGMEYEILAGTLNEKIISNYKTVQLKKGKSK